MKDKRPSFTAEGVAALRAAESTRPERERVCFDPFAKHFVGLKFGLLVRSRLLAKMAVACAEIVAPGFVGDIVGRTRHIDELLKTHLIDGVEQLVVLGAGYDSRPYRFRELNGRVKTFEVDHPATQKVKMDKVRRVFGLLPENVVYVPIDFERESLEEKLAENGYNRNLRTFFIWEGVTMYLTAEAADRTLAFVAGNSGKGSCIVFDYVFQSFLEGTSRSPDAKLLGRTLSAFEKIDEPISSEHFKFGIREGTIRDFLSTRGFDQITEVTGDYLKSEYFNGGSRDRKVLQLCGFVHATVAPRRHAGVGGGAAT